MSSLSNQYLAATIAARKNAYSVAVRSNSDGKRLGKLSFPTASTNSAAQAKESLAQAIAEEIKIREQKNRSIEKAIKAVLKKSGAVSTGRLYNSIKADIERITPSSDAGALRKKAFSVDQGGLSAVQVLGGLSKKANEQADFVATRVSRQLKAQSDRVSKIQRQLSATRLDQNVVFDIVLTAESYYEFIDKGIKAGDRNSWIAATGGSTGRAASFRGLMAWVKANPLKFRDPRHSEISDAAAAAIAANIWRKWLREGKKGKNITDRAFEIWKSRLDRSLQTSQLINRAIARSGVLDGVSGIQAEMAAFLVDQVTVAAMEGVNVNIDGLMQNFKANLDTAGMIQASMLDTLPQAALNESVARAKNETMKALIRREKARK